MLSKLSSTLIGMLGYSEAIESFFTTARLLSFEVMMCFFSAAKGMVD